MNTKAIKMPNGAAAEYAKYACNFYKGCSNSCTYCFNNRWGWGDVPTLRKCFKDEQHALEAFEKELLKNLPELQKHGLLFSFTTDPMLQYITEILTWSAAEMAILKNVPCKILTKCTGWVDDLVEYEKDNREKWKTLCAFGFTLTGHDELEPGASTNIERIKAMKKLHEAGFKTWASIEPIIDAKSSLNMIEKTVSFCDLFKVGLKSGKKYNDDNLIWFMDWAVSFINKNNSKIYFKNSLLQQAGISREELPSNCVTRDYNMFNFNNK